MCIDIHRPTYIPSPEDTLRTYILKRYQVPFDLYTINQMFTDKLKLGLNLTKARVTGTKDPSSSSGYHRYLSDPDKENTYPHSNDVDFHSHQQPIENDHNSSDAETQLRKRHTVLAVSDKLDCFGDKGHYPVKKESCKTSAHA